MGWSRAGAGFVALALALSACTSATDQVAPSTSISLGAAAAEVEASSQLRYGLAASPVDPWAHYRTSCDTSCGIVFAAITDTLFATSTDGQTVGLLVEEASTNNDSTVHTWTLRSGISFSDGTPFDAAAAKTNIDACRHSALTGPGLAGIDDVRADGNQLTLTTLAPWATLAVHFAETPCGHMFSEAWLHSLPDLPMRTEGAPFYDEAIARSQPSGDPSAPVGLGAFVMTSFAPGSGNSTVLEQNPEYWRGPSGITGEALPLAAGIELVVIGDAATRVAGLETGQFDLIHANDAAQADRIAAVGPALRSVDFSEVTHLAYNAVNDATNPLRFVSCRRAVDRSIDTDSIAALFGQPRSEGPFRTLTTEQDGADARADDGFDETVAAQWADRCAEDVGSDVTLQLLAVPGDPRATIVASMIQANSDGGIAVEVVPTEASVVGVAVLLGEYDMVLWEGFAGTHPDLHFPWWFSEAGAPIGSLATNVGRIADPALDRALVDLRRADDIAEQDQAIAEAGDQFRSGEWSTWLAAVEWTVGQRPDLDFDPARTTPEGIALVPFVNGVHSLHHIRDR